MKVLFVVIEKKLIFHLQLWHNDIKEESATQSHHPWRLRVSQAGQRGSRGKENTCFGESIYFDDDGPSHYHPYHPVLSIIANVFLFPL